MLSWAIVTGTRVWPDGVEFAPATVKPFGMSRCSPANRDRVDMPPPEAGNHFVLFFGNIPTAGGRTMRTANARRSKIGARVLRNENSAARRLLALHPWLAGFPRAGDQSNRTKPVDDSEVTVRSFLCVGLGLAALVMAVRGGSTSHEKSGFAGWTGIGSSPPSDGAIEIVGRTQPGVDQQTTIAPVSTHSVVYLDVKCDLTPPQADELGLGQFAEVRVSESEGPMVGRLVSIGSAPEQRSGLVPAVVRVHNTEQRLRGNMTVSVRFPAATPLGGSDITQSR